MTRSTNSRGAQRSGLSVCTAFMCAVFLAAGARPAQAGVNVWTRNGPAGGEILEIAVDPATPSTLYAGTSGVGMFKSTDGGGTWSNINTGRFTWSAAALAIDPKNTTTLYAGWQGFGGFGTTGPDGGLLKSTDAGRTWSDTGGPPGDALAIDPRTPTTLYAVGGGRVFKSTDGGGTWSDTGLSTSWPYTWGTALAIDPQTPTTLYAGAGADGHGGVFKSTDAGATWSPLNAGLTSTGITALAIDPKTPSRLYAASAMGSYSGGLFVIDQVSACVGDCNDASTVTIDELLTMVNIALGTAAVSECLAGDDNQNGSITVDELLTAVNNALNGCGD